MSLEKYRRFRWSRNQLNSKPSLEIQTFISRLSIQASGRGAIAKGKSIRLNTYDKSYMIYSISKSVLYYGSQFERNSAYNAIASFSCNAEVISRVISTDNF